MKQLGCFNRYSLLLIVTLSPVLISFASLVFPERHIVMILPWLLYFLVRWDSTLQLRYLFLVLLCAHFFLYLKEPNFVFLASIALLRLVSPLSKAGSALLSHDYSGCNGLV
jgi:hypothetical protein